MPILRIQPISYSGKRLPELGERVLRALYPRIDDFVIRPGIQYEAAYQASGDKSDPPASLPSVGPDFLDYLARYGRFVLGITSLPAIRNQYGDWLFGQARPSVQVAYVSSSRPPFKALDSDEHVERLSIEAIHEAGHIFGLNDHYRVDKKTRSGKRCPMTRAHASDARRGVITWEDYISSRDFVFCPECCGSLASPG